MEAEHVWNHACIRLAGSINEAAQDRFFSELDALLKRGDGPLQGLLLEVSTQGGDANIGERLAEEIRLLRSVQRIHCRFQGTSYVYSAGVTLMSAFPVQDRTLTRNTTLLIHERQMDKQMSLCGPIGACLLQVEQLKGELENGRAIQEAGFARLVEGSDISLEEVLERARRGWYLSAEEAAQRGLVAHLI